MHDTFDPWADVQPCDNCGHGVPFDVDEGTVMATKPCLNCQNGHAHYGPEEATILV